MNLQSNYNVAQFGSASKSNEEYKGDAPTSDEPTIPVDLAQDPGLVYRPLCSLVSEKSNTAS